MFIAEVLAINGDENILMKKEHLTYLNAILSHMQMADICHR